ncbi:non-ribosomal peptide synthetase [Nocardiopsis sp. JB363]|uniref:non-ribosomal peptide synthetase n=1 Tax=Nocardiopsis sp. JB363 TaxID=1434837 RepID=UPI00097A9C19|nr:non-ribosomal peptide synthetase [Nocardiopsis sp. JB363]SIO90373.1 Siderophore biosynthesis non-ribosomal peptide synthetase modules @ Bacillibactin synthetase component F [Nocardiopsis sp. JB363]
MGTESYLDRVREQRGLHPDRPALTWREGIATYKDVLGGAETLATDLVRSGVRREDRVAMRVPRGPHVAVAFMGIHMAGATVVPVPIDDPPERVDAVLRDVGVGVVVRTPDAPPASDGVAQVVVALSEPGGRRPRTEAPTRPLGENAAAYVLHTSGSTGRPRGVVIEHGSLNRYLDWCTRTVLDTDVPILATSSIGFDSFLKQVLGPLCSGGTVRLLDDREATDPSRLLALLSRADSALDLNCTPSLWRAVLAEARGTSGSFRHLRRLLLGGEAIDADLLSKTCEEAPTTELWNLYGPTEATANVLAGPVLDDVPALGSPVAGARIRVLDDGLSPVPAGGTGMLYIGGDVLARGYQDLPGITADRFVPDPDGTGTRMFRSGDRVRVTEDGQIVFVGRTDRMVKRSGVRIELDEVAAAFRRLPSVTEAAVLTDTDPDGGERLVCFVESPGGAAVDVARLRSQVRRWLPTAAVPDLVRVSEELPRTSGGKLDLATLRTWSAGSDTETGRARDSQDELTASLCVVWAEVLELDHVAPDADFFEIGGHSLAMLRITGRVADSLGVEHDVDVFFDAPTVEQYTALVRELMPMATEEMSGGTR